MDETPAIGLGSAIAGNTSEDDRNTMKRDVYTPPPLPADTPANESRQKRRAANKAKAAHKPRSEMSPDELTAVRAANLERQKAYLRRKRIRAGLPPVGKPGRPRKQPAA